MPDKHDVSSERLTKDLFFKRAKQIRRAVYAHYPDHGLSHLTLSHPDYDDLMFAFEIDAPSRPTMEVHGFIVKAAADLGQAQVRVGILRPQELITKTVRLYR